MGAMIIDEFAGAGGASCGLAKALGRSPDVAINHNATALDMHEANHPETDHKHADVRDVDLRALAAGRDVAGLWMSPSCTDHSPAGGKKELQHSIRSLPEMMHVWADAVRPAVFWLENVPDIVKWGPLANGRPDKAQEGQSWQRLLEGMDDRGYKVEHRVLRAHDYGAATIRERLFLVARSDGHEIRWPKPTHGVGLTPHRQAWEIIDWNRPTRSIFGRKRGLVDGTLKRIADGVVRRVLEAEEPHFCDGVIVSDTGHEPGAEICASFIVKHFSGHRGTPLSHPLGAITTRDHHSLLQVKLRRGDTLEGRRCASFLVKYYRDGGQHPPLLDPLHTITTKSRLALVCVQLQGMEICDIGMRMLLPHELFAAQGFDEGYNFEVGASGHRFTQEEQIFCCGNSVNPILAELVAGLNMPVM